MQGSTLGLTGPVKQHVGDPDGASEAAPEAACCYSVAIC